LQIFPLGNTAISIEFSKEISEPLNQYIVALAAYLQANHCGGFVEVVPAYSSLTVFYQPSPAFRFLDAKNWLELMIQTFEEKKTLIAAKPTLISIPCSYTSEDLNFVAEHNNLSISDVIQIHSNATYRVYMMGFMPGFAYLGGLDARIATPRRTTPRAKVPAGSVGIAGNQTGIYPIASPGGWQLIGQTDVLLFSRFKEPNSLLKAGDLVRFMPV
jgi:inhibitor of KinA